MNRKALFQVALLIPLILLLTASATSAKRLRTYAPGIAKVTVSGASGYTYRVVNLPKAFIQSELQAMRIRMRNDQPVRWVVVVTPSVNGAPQPRQRYETPGPEWQPMTNRWKLVFPKQPATKLTFTVGVKLITKMMTAAEQSDQNIRLAPNDCDLDGDEMD
jgi:hypothetical protein